MEYRRSSGSQATGSPWRATSTCTVSVENTSILCTSRLSLPRCPFVRGVGLYLTRLCLIIYVAESVDTAGFDFGVF